MIAPRGATWLFVLSASLGAVTILGSAAALFGRWRWRRNNSEFRAQLQGARLPAEPLTYDAGEVEQLPLPVRRYFHAVLTDGQPIITAVRFSQAGEFRTGEAEETWRPFTATQLVTMRPRAFDWDARIRTAPAIDVFVQDAFSDGTGILHAALAGLFTVADLRGTQAIAEGELMRYLGEAPSYPTALLPSQGVLWEAIDESSARATLSDGVTTASLVFRFDANDLIVSASGLRSRMVSGRVVQQPWQGRCRRYSRRSVMLIPLELDAQWQPVEGLFPYFQCRITDLSFEFAAARSN